MFNEHMLFDWLVLDLAVSTNYGAIQDHSKTHMKGRVDVVLTMDRQIVYMGNKFLECTLTWL